MRPPPAILVLAAGASSRMRGADKLLEPVDGIPLILRAVRAACAVSARVVVTLPPNSDRAAWLGDSPARRITVAGRAMSASIRAGVTALPDADAILIHLADMPDIAAPELQALADAWTTGTFGILRATAADGTPGQPVVFAREHFPALLSLTGDRGARDLLAGPGVAHLPLPGRAALTDLDTPEDWAEWRTRHH